MRRIAKWGTVLVDFDIKYMPHTSVKGQVLAHLVVELAKLPLEEVVATQNIGGKLVGTISLQEPYLWKVYIDGAANQKGFGVGLVLITPEKLIIEKSLRLTSRPRIMRLNMKLYWRECPWFKKWEERQ